MVATVKMPLFDLNSFLRVFITWRRGGGGAVILEYPYLGILSRKLAILHKNMPIYQLNIGPMFGGFFLQKSDRIERYIPVYLLRVGTSPLEV